MPAGTVFAARQCLDCIVVKVKSLLINSQKLILEKCIQMTGRWDDGFVMWLIAVKCRTDI